jgi:hypothetical protein
MGIQKATVISVTAWNAATFQSFPDPLDPDGYTSSLHVSYGTTRYLGDENGKPIKILGPTEEPGSRYMDEDTLRSEAFLGEMVTREDGSQVTLFELLSEKLTKAIQPMLIQGE